MAEPKAQRGQESLHQVLYALAPVQATGNAINKYLNL